MTSSVYVEGNLQFTFSGYVTVEKFDDNQKNPYGMKSVDFVAEDTEKLYFLEVKDYQHPLATQEQIDYSLSMLQDASRNKSLFCVKMGQKVKDSLLRKYALGDVINKDVVFLLLINFDTLGKAERALLKSRISGFIPTGLNESRFLAFTSISFELVNAENLEEYGITCTAIAEG
jgi:hypothetical protein